ncbi:axonemal dynein light chain domain-containing protein 1 [Bombina bombina]|uniref:axonemal dynein light chain domain-containing protein 1 n=1 Tax=Bombina bombina TaxID=8345 RepID=UPI00235A74EF|nr:axonemal dynein light chain domain-containing protein 1 [Bombina bombina]
MSVAEFPSPPLVPKPSPRRTPGSRNLVPNGDESTELTNQYTAVERYQHMLTSQQDEFIPDEILQVLTSTANTAERSDLAIGKKNNPIKNGKGGLRSIDPVWHHPLRRSRFKHLTDQPICLTGAGRDISFLCDALLLEKKKKAVSSHHAGTLSNEISLQSTEGGVEESLIPKEFYVVKNKGVLGLEYYEDKYTTLLEDDEKKLRLFPSMKPSGRAEVLQLMKVMDTMLKDAGVDEENLNLDGPTQIHNLMELLKTEQNIYNIVFHELIRQVSVECVERGELLAKLRQRYVTLLDKIPRQVLSLHNDLVAQRALDRCLTEEIIHFRNAIGELTNELYMVREHDLRVSRDAKLAQEELARALKEAKKNANLLQEYRELYELQRSRLETQLGHLTEERDLWSSATYRLARKVIEANELQLARRLYLSENSWTKVIRHFIVLLASKDTTDLSRIQQTTEKWREHMIHFEQDIERNEESSREKLRRIRSELEKWQLHFQENIFVGQLYQTVPDEVALDILKDIKIWENMLTEELQRFEGDLLLGNRDSLKTASDIHKRWVELAERVLRRHRRMNGELAPEHKAMEDMNQSISQLYEQYARRIEGENGVAKSLMTFFDNLTSWSLTMHVLKDTPHRIKESDWFLFYQLIPDWIALADKTIGFIGSPQSEGRTCLDTVEKVRPQDIYKMVQQWVLATTHGTERDDAHLTHEASSLHTAMVQFMVNMLILMSPDYSSKPSELMFATQFEEEVDEITGQKVQEEALSLAEKVSSFSNYIIRCCQEMAESISREKSSLADEDPDNELRELQSVKNSCNEWIETCQLILSDATGYLMPSLASLGLSISNGPEEGSPLATGNEAQQHTAAQSEYRSSKKATAEFHPQKQDSAEFLAEDYIIHKKPSEEENAPLSPQDQKILSSKQNLLEKKTPESDVMMIIGHDGNIHNKSLKGEEIPVSSEGFLTGSRPDTPKSLQAFEYLTSLEQLQNRLLLAEQRAQHAEERSENLDEQLKAALQKIQELEKMKQRDESNKILEDSSSEVQTTAEEIVSKPTVKKAPKSAKSKKMK